MPTCPTCGGTAKVDGNNHGTEFGWPYGWSCPDCSDGHVPLARLVALWEAVWAFEMRELQWGDEYDAGAQAAIEQLRATVKP